MSWYYRESQQPQSGYYYSWFPFPSPFPEDRLEERVARLEREITRLETQNNRQQEEIRDLEKRVRRLEQRVGL